MASPSTVEPIPPEIRSLLSALRWRIRAYVWLQGLSLAIAWLGLTFWIGLALDYLPVLAGVGEMPLPARVALLALIAGILAFILYRYILRRVFARLADRSMAMLLERRNAALGESLITAVELGSRPQTESERMQEMLAATREQALSALRDVRLSNVFNFRPLALSITSAVLLLGTIGIFYAVNATAWELGFGRLYLLKNDTWPRHARIEVVGVDLRELGTGEEINQITQFREGLLKVAKGSSLGLIVKADASRKVVPEVCVIQYRTAEGDSGRVNMTRIGRIRDGYQLYRYEGKPFDGILSDIEFDAVGFDHRVTGHRLQVVDSPTVVSVDVACRFPAYMVDEKLSLWLPRTIELTSGTELPRGTKLKLTAASNKPLKQVQLSNPDTNQVTTIDVEDTGPRSHAFEHVVERLEDHLTLDVILTDTDEVRSERPYRIHITGVEDTPPVIEMRLRGIGTAVTPNVLIPAVGKISDDYGLAKAWLEASLNDAEPKEYRLEPSRDGTVELAVDFRAERALPEGLNLEPGGKLQLTVKAADRMDLGSGPNQATGDQYQLEVVSPEQLLTLLESRELGLRRRFEQIISELTETRDTLVRIRSEGPESAAKTESSSAAAVQDADSPGQTPNPAATDPAAAAAESLERVWSLRSLRAQQSLLQSQKSAQEVLGIAAGFLDIHEELINNRVDTEDRKTRLKDQVATPLDQIGRELFPALDRQLEELQKAVAAVEAGGRLQQEDTSTLAAVDGSLDQANKILQELDAVLQRMLDLESFNELLDIVRSLIADQERVSAETKKEQKKAILDLLK